MRCAARCAQFGAFNFRLKFLSSVNRLATNAAQLPTFLLPHTKASSLQLTILFQLLHSIGDEVPPSPMGYLALTSVAASNYSLLRQGGQSQSEKLFGI